MTNDSAPAPNIELQTQLLEEMRRGNNLTAELIRNQRDWKLQLRQGLLTGLGGVIGATVLVSLLVWLLQPFRQLQVLGPALDRLSRQIDKPAK